MQSSTVTWGHWLIPRVFSSNPVVRRVDRVESAILMVLVAVSLVCTAVAGAVGTQVYDTKSTAYAQRMKSLHNVTATAVQDSSAVVQPNVVVYVTNVKWQNTEGTQAQPISSSRKMAAGERTSLWVDAQGNPVVWLPTPRRAAYEAAVTAVAMWLLVTGSAATLFVLLRLRFDRSRYVQWERELRSLAGDGGGRASRQK